MKRRGAGRRTSRHATSRTNHVVCDQPRFLPPTATLAGPQNMPCPPSRFFIASDRHLTPLCGIPGVDPREAISHPPPSSPTIQRQTRRVALRHVPAASCASAGGAPWAAMSFNVPVSQNLSQPLPSMGRPRTLHFGSDGPAALGVPPPAPASQRFLALPTEEEGYTVTVCNSVDAADDGARIVQDGAFDLGRRTMRAWVGVEAVWLGEDGPALGLALASASSAVVLPLWRFSGDALPSSWRRLLMDPQLQKMACRAADVKGALGRAGVSVHKLHDILASYRHRYSKTLTCLSAATSDMFNLALPYMLPLRHTDWEVSKLFSWQTRMLALYAFGVFRVTEVVRVQRVPPIDNDGAHDAEDGEDGEVDGGQEAGEEAVGLV